MRFLWTSVNIAHVSKHVPISVAESVARSVDQDALTPSRDGLTFTGFGSYSGEPYFIAYMTSRHQSDLQVYIITCYRKRRGKSRRRHQ